MKIASEQELIAKINRLQQVKGEHLKYEVLTEMQVLPTELMRSSGYSYLGAGVGYAVPAASCSQRMRRGTEWPTAPEGGWLWVARL